MARDKWKELNDALIIVDYYFVFWKRVAVPSVSAALSRLDGGGSLHGGYSVSNIHWIFNERHSNIWRDQRSLEWHSSDSSEVQILNRSETSELNGSVHSAFIRRISFSQFKNKIKNQLPFYLYSRPSNFQLRHHSLLRSPRTIPREALGIFPKVQRLNVTTALPSSRRVACAAGLPNDSFETMFGDQLARTDRSSC